MSNRAKGIIAIIASAFGFAVMATCVRWTDSFGDYIPCFEKSFFRNFVALVIAAAAFAKMQASRGRSAHDARRGLLVSHEQYGGGRSAHGAWRGLLVSHEQYGVVRAGYGWIVTLVIRCVLGTIGIFSNFYALSHIPIADGQTLNKTAPFWTLLFAWIFLGEKVSKRQFLAVAIAFIGAALVVKPGFAGVDAFPLAMGLLGGICAGGAYAAVRSLGKHSISTSLIVLAFSGFSCIASIPLTMMDYVPLTFAQFLVLSGAGAGAAIGQFGITLAYRYAAPREIAVFDYTNILFTAALGYLLFGQVSDWLSIGGMLVIVSAAILLSRRT